MKTYHDIFVEQLIRRERPGGELLFRLGCIFLGFILITIAFVFGKSFFPVLFAVVIILEFFAFVYTVKEFEYSFVNGDFDIDEILGKRKRKQVFSCSAREIVSLQPVSEGAELPAGEFTRTLDASVSKNAPDRWRMIVERQDGTREQLIFSPNDRLMAAFRETMGRKVAKLPKAAETEEEA